MSFSFSSLFKSHSETTAVGIDIGSSSIKVVEIEKKGNKAVLKTYGSVGLGPYANIDVGTVTNLPLEKITEALTEVLKQSGITTKASALSIPVQASLIFKIELPPQIKEQEIDAIIPTEARKYIPVPITEVSIDYFVVPQKEKTFEEANNSDVPVQSTPTKTEVLVVAIQNDVIAKYRSLVTQTALSTTFFELEIFSAIRANFEHELSLVLLMDFGASRTKLSLVEFGTLKGYHTINRGGADLTASIAQTLNIPFAKAEQLKKEHGMLPNSVVPSLPDIITRHLGYIFSETNNVLLTHEKKYNQTITKIILTGGGALLKGIPELANASMRTEIEIGHPFSKIGAPEFLEKVFEATGPEFAVAIGLALRKLQ